MVIKVDKKTESPQAKPLSRTTSCNEGASPSGGLLSNNDSAKALAVLQANKLPRRLPLAHDTGSSLARCLARARRNCAVSSDHIPPTSAARRARPPAPFSSGYVLSLRRLASWSTAPPLTEVPLFRPNAGETPSWCPKRVQHRQATATHRR